MKLTLVAMLLPLLTLGARWDYSAADTEIALESASQRARCIVWAESRNDPNAIGQAGELGAIQLHPRGLLGDYFAQGYTDPFDPYQAVEYLDAALARGMAGHWSPVLRGMC